MTTFAEIVDAADQLSIDEQQSLVDILSRRIAQANRAALAKRINEARNEFTRGEARAASPSEIMAEVRGES